ncbi:Protein of unknown function [Pyronema omphalodes CBS 100304]|uniref:Uncharacterized protein n=1 Tax=Pyronema omphalodes (strain CBS 100304) TaxID=1076935 RepID=U4LEM9_PYROM|nr:Protein of unknown function [Pyronema omphalodes CBS 100304]
MGIDPHSSQTTRTCSWHKYPLHTGFFLTLSPPAPFFASSNHRQQLTGHGGRSKPILKYQRQNHRMSPQKD